MNETNGSGDPRGPNEPAITMVSFLMLMVIVSRMPSLMPQGIGSLVMCVGLVAIVVACVAGGVIRSRKVAGASRSQSHSRTCQSSTCGAMTWRIAAARRGRFSSCGIVFFWGERG
jgi:hypothetical protein